MTAAAVLADAKQRLRRMMKARMEALGKDGIAARSRALCRQILASLEFREADTVLGYLSFRNELSVDGVLREALRQGKTVTVPFIVSRTEFRAAVLPSLTEDERHELWRGVKKLLLKEVAPSWAPCFD